MCRQNVWSSFDVVSTVTEHKIEERGRQLEEALQNGRVLKSGRGDRLDASFSSVYSQLLVTPLYVCPTLMQYWLQISRKSAGRPQSEGGPGLWGFGGFRGLRGLGV